MKKRLLLITIVLAIAMSLLVVPTAFAESEDIPNSISINVLNTPHKEVDWTGKNVDKTIDMFVGESVTLKTDIYINKVVVIEDSSTIKANYKSSNDLFSITETAYSDDKYDTANAYLRRNTATITANAVGQDQLIVTYLLGGKTYFDSVDINIHDANIESMELSSNVTNLRTDHKVDFDILINGKETLDVSQDITCKIGGVVVDSLNAYTLPSNAGSLPVEITYNGKTYNSTLDVVKASPLTSAPITDKAFGFMLSSGEAVIPLYVTADSYPNISINTDSVTLLSATKVESDKEGYDKYELKIKLHHEVIDEHMLILVDDQGLVTTLNVIDKIKSVTIVPESTQFESNKVARFHVAINGVMDVVTPVKWTVNGSEQKTTANVLEYKSISNNKITISALVGDAIPAEYSYEIDTSTNSIILTVVVAIVVIIICIPILIALKKSPKPNLKAMVKKDNAQTIEKLRKIKADIETDNTKSQLKQILKINASITRSEKRAQQESFECENKAFGGALSQLSSAKELADTLLKDYKTNSHDVNIAMIDNIIECLDASNSIISKVEENM